MQERLDHSHTPMTTLTAGGYTSDNSMPEDTQDIDVSSIITGYTAYLSSVDGG